MNLWGNMMTECKIDCIKCDTTLDKCRCDFKEMSKLSHCAQVKIMQMFSAFYLKDLSRCEMINWGLTISMNVTFERKDIIESTFFKKGKSSIDYSRGALNVTLSRIIDYDSNFDLFKFTLMLKEKHLREIRYHYIRSHNEFPARSVRQKILRRSPKCFFMYEKQSIKKHLNPLSFLEN